MASRKPPTQRQDGRRRQLSLGNLLKNEKDDRSTRNGDGPRTAGLTTSRSKDSQEAEPKSTTLSRTKTKILASRVNAIASQSIHGASSSLQGLLRGRSPVRRTGSGDSSRTSSVDSRQRSKHMSRALTSASMSHLPIIPPDLGKEERVLDIQGWLNVGESSVKKEIPQKETWRLHIGTISNGRLTLYRPHGLHYKFFETVASPDGSTNFADGTTVRWDNLVHRTKERHPELVVDPTGKILRGSKESICHEIIFGKDTQLVKDAVYSLPSWINPLTALSYLSLYASLEATGDRVYAILQLLEKRLIGLYLDISFVRALHGLVDSIGSRQSTNVSRTHVARMHEKIDTDTDKARAMQLKATRIVEEVVSSRASNASSLNITAEDLMDIDSRTFAEQLALFHLNFQKEWSPVKDFSAILQIERSHLSENPLVFTDKRIHFLTRLILEHILGGDLKKNSRHRRAALLNKWIEIGKSVQEHGDMVGWIAIVMGITSPAILRLKDTWELIPDEHRQFVADHWETVALDLQKRKVQVSHHKKRPHIIVPQNDGLWLVRTDVVPYLGDLSYLFEDIHVAEDMDVEIGLYGDAILAMKESLERWIAWTSSGTRPEGPPPPKRVILSVQRRLHAINAMYRDHVDLDAQEFYQQSVQCEPSPLGNYLQAHYTTSWPLQAGNSSALVFTEVLPQYALFDAKETVSSTAQAFSSPNDMVGTMKGMPKGPPRGPSPVQPTVRRVRSFPPSHSAITGDLQRDSQAHRAASNLKGGRDGILKAIRDLTGVESTSFSTLDEELVLKAITGPTDGRPVSQILEENRRSVQRVSAMLSPSAVQETFMLSPTSESTSSGELESGTFVVVKGGSLERLVDILVLGFENFKKRLHELTSDDLPADMQMDMDVFLPTFFATYRSFCSPIVLIEYLRKRLIGAKSASSMDGRSVEDAIFPDWSRVEDVDLEFVDWRLVADIHSGVLKALLHWVDTYFEDFNLDPLLREQLGVLLVTADHELQQWKLLLTDQKFAENERLKEQIQEIHEMAEDVQTLFSIKSFHPPEPPAMLPCQEKPLQIPTGDVIQDLEAFVQDLNTAANFYLQRVTIADWMGAFELLECQGTETLGFFTSKPVALVPEEELVIQDVFSFFQKTKAHGSNLSLFASFPRRIRELMYFHEELVQFFLGKITAPHLTIVARSDMIAQLLRALGLCRTLMSQWDLQTANDASSVPSFVSVAIASALVHPDSRMMLNSWATAVNKTSDFKGQVGNLKQVIPKISAQMITQTPQLVPSISWLFERMLEIICFIPNMLTDNSRLINFDKRRYVYNLVVNVTESGSSIEDLELLPFTIPARPKIERHQVRAMAQVEIDGSRGNKPRLFWQILTDEAEKTRRDGRQRETINRQMRESSKSGLKRGPGFMALLKSVRPLSMSFASHSPTIQSTTLSVDLPSVDSMDWGKPSVVLKLSNIETKAPRAAGLPHIISLRSRHKQKQTVYYIQCPGAERFEAWSKAIEAVTGMPLENRMSAAARNTEASGAAVAEKQRLFGISLDSLVKRNNVPLPVQVLQWNTIVEEKGRSEVGIYRVSASRATLRTLRAAYERGEDPDLKSDEYLDVNIFTGIMKDFLRELPEKFFTPSQVVTIHQSLIAAREKPAAETLTVVRQAIDMISKPKRDFLIHYFNHLNRVAAFANKTKMNLGNLSLVCGISFSDDPVSSHAMCKAFLENIPLLGTESSSTPAEESAAPDEVVLEERPTTATSDPIVRPMTRAEVPPPIMVQEDTSGTTSTASPDSSPSTTSRNSLSVAGVTALSSAPRRDNSPPLIPPLSPRRVRAVPATAAANGRRRSTSDGGFSTGSTLVESQDGAAGGGGGGGGGGVEATESSTDTRSGGRTLRNASGHSRHASASSRMTGLSATLRNVQ